MLNSDPQLIAERDTIPGISLPPQGELVRGRAHEPIARLRSRVRPPEFWAGVAFFASGCFLTLVVGVEVGIEHRVVFSRGLFAFTHAGAPLCFAVIIGTGFLVRRSRLAMTLSLLAIGFTAIWSGWARYGLPSIDITVPRAILAVAMLAGGFALMVRSRHRQ